MSMTDEERARQSGWVPQDEFKGDPERWTDAKDWNDRADNIMPILRATNKRLEEKLETTETRLSELQSTMQKINKTFENVSEREYDRAMATIKSQQKEAINSSDGDAWEALEAKKEQLVKSKPVVSTPAPPDALKDFYSRNKWYGKDDDMTDYADIMGNRFHRQGITDPVEQLKKVEAAVKEKFPEKFGNKRRDEQTVDTTTGLPPKKTKKFTYDSLPQEAKDACDNTVKSCLRANPGLEKETIIGQWVADYYEDEMEA